jgi:pimeloyl-ACP methyl ester carboxylesterase
MPGYVQFVPRLFAVALMLPPATAWAEPQLQVFAIRGLAGVVFSRGLNRLCEELASFPQVACTVRDFYEEADVTREASDAIAERQRLVLVGHSFGAQAALRIAAAMKGSVSLIVTIDPNWFPAPPRVPKNAEVVINYYQDVDVIGRGTLQPSPAFHGRFYQVRRGEPHIMIDGSPEVHAEILSQVKDILSTLKSSRARLKPSR